MQNFLRPPWLKLLFGLGLVSLLGYAGICLLVRSFQESLLLFPTHDTLTTPKAEGMDYQALEVPSGDAKLSVWKIPPSAHPQGTFAKTLGGQPCWVLHCHGNGGNISHRLHVARFLHEQGIGVVLFDYRGFGQSSGRITQESDLIQDAQAALDTLKGQRVILFGESLGGGVAGQLALRNAVDGLVLQSTFTSLTERARESYPYLPISMLSRYRLDNLQAVREFAGPKLILHSRDDEVTGFHHGQQLAAHAGPNHLFVELKGGHNAFSLTHQEFQPFLAQCLKAKVSTPPGPRRPGS